MWWSLKLARVLGWLLVSPPSSLSYPTGLPVKLYCAVWHQHHSSLPLCKQVSTRAHLTDFNFFISLSKTFSSKCYFCKSKKKNISSRCDSYPCIMAPSQDIHWLMWELSAGLATSETQLWLSDLRAATSSPPLSLLFWFNIIKIPLHFMKCCLLLLWLVWMTVKSYKKWKTRIPHLSLLNWSYCPGSGADKSLCIIVRHIVGSHSLIL